jgi:hypothetical protein
VILRKRAVAPVLGGAASNKELGQAVNGVL